jgi:DNA gyrase subunit A
MAADEEFILTITENGYGKRSSAYEYRITNRGGQGIVGIDTGARNGAVVAAFAVDHSDELMLVTDMGKLIRMPVDDIRISGRATQGVTLFRTAESERVVSSARLGILQGEEGEVVEEIAEEIEVVEEEKGSASDE